MGAVVSLPLSLAAVGVLIAGESDELLVWAPDRFSALRSAVGGAVHQAARIGWSHGLGDGVDLGLGHAGRESSDAADQLKRSAAF